MPKIRKSYIFLFITACIAIGVILFFLFEKDVYYKKVKLPELLELKDFNPDSAAHWDQMSEKAMLNESRHLALITGLKSLCLEDNEERRQRLSHLIGQDWKLWEKTFIRYPSISNTLLYNQKGNRVLVGNRLYDPANSEQELGRLDDVNISAADFSGDDRLLLTGSNNKITTVHLWDGQTAKAIGKQLELKTKIKAVAFSHDNSRFFTCDEKMLRFWTTDRLEEFRNPVNFDFLVKTAVFNDNGMLLFVTSHSDIGYFIETSTGKRFGKPIENKQVHSPTFSKDSRHLYFHAYSIYRFEIASGQLDDVALTGHTFSLNLDRSNQYLATYNYDNSIKILDLESNQLVSMYFNINSSIGTSNMFRFSPDGEHLLISSNRETALCFRLEENLSDGIILDHLDNVSYISVCENGEKIFSISGGKLNLWNTNDGTLIDTGPHIKTQGRIMAVSPDDWVALTSTYYCNSPNECQLWNIKTGEPMGKSFPMNDRINSAVYRSRDKTMITCSEKGIIRFFSTHTGKEKKKPIPLPHEADGIFLSPNQIDIVACIPEYDCNTLRIINSEPGERIVMSGPHFISCRFDQTGRKLLIQDMSSSDDYLIWDLKTEGKIELSHKKLNLIKKSSFNAPLFTPDGNGLIVLTDSNWIHYLDISSGQYIPVASRLLPGKWEKLIKFMDETGKQLKALLKLSGKSFQIETIRFDEYSEPPIQGKPEQLLREWEKRFAWCVYDNGNIGILTQKLKE